MGASYLDLYLSRNVSRLGPGGVLAAPGPPPLECVQLLINSAYHLMDTGQYIGPGPEAFRPVGKLPKPARDL